MRQSEHDIPLFTALNSPAISPHFFDYVERLCQHLQDLNGIETSLPPEQLAIEVKGRKRAVQVLQEYFVRRVKVAGTWSGVSADNFE